MTKPSLRKRADYAKKFRSKTLVCVAENPKLLHNFMSIVRAAEAMGVGKVYVIDEPNKLKLPSSWHSMRDNPQYLNLSASGIKWLFVRKFSSTEECLKYLSKKNFTNVVTSPHQKGKKNVNLYDGKYTQKQLAIWFGNESIGISEEAVNAADFCVQIPMYGIIESMNLSSSASIVLNFIVDRRQEFSKKKLARKKSKKLSLKK